MNCHSTIPVHDILGSSIHSRDASTILMRRIQDNLCDSIDLDFESVEIVSRAFADQFHIDKLNCAAECNKRIIVVNASDNVLKMFQAVAKTQNQIRKLERVPVYKYSTWLQLDNFLLNF